MRDELFDRDYQAGRVELNAGIDRAVAKFGRTLVDSFEALHRVQWSAPWQAKSKRIGRA